jgi:hypothetical protein
MKKQLNTRGLRLSKQTIQHLGTPLQMDDQKAIKGGSENAQAPTQVPVLCGP